MNFKSALIHNTGWRIIGIFFTFLNNVLIVRWLGVTDSGSFFYFLAILMLIIVFLKLGIENGIVYFSSKYAAQTGSVFYLMLPLMLLQSIIAFVAIRLLQPAEIHLTIAWTTIYVISNIYFYYISAFYQSRKMFVSINIINTISTVAQTVFLIWLWLSKWRSASFSSMQLIFYVLTVITVLQMVVLTINYYFSNKTAFRNLSFDKKISGALLKFSGINFLITVLIFLLSRIDFYFVSKYCDQFVLGNYMQVAKIGQMALIIPGLLGGVIFPYSIHQSSAIENKFSFISRIMSFVFLIVFITIIAIGKFIIPVIFGNDFTLVYPGLLIIFPGIFFLALSTLLLSYFEGKNLPQLVVKSFFFVLIMVSAGDYFLVPAYGFKAAAGVFSFSTFFGMIMLVREFSKKNNVSPKQLFLLQKSDWPFMLAQLKK